MPFLAGHRKSGLVIAIVMSGVSAEDRLIRAYAVKTFQKESRA
jgi:hypothetical protein